MRVEIAKRAEQINLESCKLKERGGDTKSNISKLGHNHQVIYNSLEHSQFQHEYFQPCHEFKPIVYMLECLMDKNVYIMIEWEGLMGKYLAQGHDIQTRCSDCKPNIFF